MGTYLSKEGELRTYILEYEDDEDNEKKQKIRRQLETCKERL